MMDFLFTILFLLKATGSSCHSDVKQGFDRASNEYKVTRVGRFDPRIAETSGLVRLEDGSMLAVGDSGCPSTMYKVDSMGQLLDSTEFELPNRDWEELLTDQRGRFFIADTGNNRNKRRDLRIFAYTEHSEEIDTLRFSYADQLAYPPMEDSLRFDCEAAVWSKGELHLFSKNRGKDWGVRQYVLPDTAGIYRLMPEEGQVWLKKTQITAACLNPNGQILALLSYGKVFLFRVEDGVSLERPYRVIKYAYMGQSESIAFVNDTDWVVVNEKGKMFLFSEKKLKH